MLKIINKDALDELQEVLGKGIYEGYTLERIQREAPDFHFYLKENHEVLACCSIWKSSSKPLSGCAPSILQMGIYPATSR